MDPLNGQAPQLPSKNPTTETIDEWTTSTSRTGTSNTTLTLKEEGILLRAMQDAPITSVVPIQAKGIGLTKPRTPSVVLPGSSSAPKKMRGSLSNVDPTLIVQSAKGREGPELKCFERTTKRDKVIFPLERDIGGHGGAKKHKRKEPEVIDPPTLTETQKKIVTSLAHQEMPLQTPEGIHSTPVVPPPVVTSSLSPTEVVVGIVYGAPISSHPSDVMTEQVQDKPVVVQPEEHSKMPIEIIDLELLKEIPRLEMVDIKVETYIVEGASVSQQEIHIQDFDQSSNIKLGAQPQGIQIESTTPIVESEMVTQTIMDETSVSDVFYTKIQPPKDSEIIKESEVSQSTSTTKETITETAKEISRPTETNTEESTQTDNKGKNQESILESQPTKQQEEDPTKKKVVKEKSQGDLSTKQPLVEDKDISKNKEPFKVLSLDREIPKEATDVVATSVEKLKEDASVMATPDESSRETTSVPVISVEGKGQGEKDNG
ncbi:hypothetical protein KI387_043675 [Taxus chinensis]|uniref:Uncharacterized protein n=1 Tax=Taxus chinensis TaxID=29808 RepID=A0AA38BZY0_TAXCH|nr:hypothetical protein KI387_043675 [Taxus chinensis]